MDRANLLWRAHVGLTLVAHDLVEHAQLFEQPQHPLRARIVEMMNGQHVASPGTNFPVFPYQALAELATCDSSAVAQRAKADPLRMQNIYPDNIDTPII